jgi:predicted glycogen debranching enzyme
MQMKFSKENIMPDEYSSAANLEWIETNGLGGFASSTITGANTRRYHALLTAAMNPPVKRISLLSKLDETIICGEDKFELGTNQFPGAVYPEGFHLISNFAKKLFPQWIYKLPNGIKLKKTIACVHGENTTLVVYEVLKANTNFILELLPLVSARDIHTLNHVNTSVNRDVEFENSTLTIKPYNNLPGFFILAAGSEFRVEPDWYYNFEYQEELSRGHEYNEDLFTPGKLFKELKEGDKFGIVITTENPEGKNAVKGLNKEKLRREKLIDKCKDETEKKLILAADQFIVKRGAERKTIIAGYHWFSDWGRDTMIALPGLCLSTQRYADAKKILLAFAESVDKGMLPNHFPDNGEVPEYNTADATLWFFIAIKKYLDATGDKKFVLKIILPVLHEIIDWHLKGTRHNIHVNNDGLLYQGEEGQQLTWMDARVGNWVVTPRIGKAVEINALWYNALIIFSELLELNKQNEQSFEYFMKAKTIKDQFTGIYWNENNNCLYDFVNRDIKDDSIRPNQLFAISLPYPLIPKVKARLLLKTVKEQLYTPVGLRSLSQDHKDYHGHYGGDQLSRDGAYHQGTVWSWLLGPYIDAIINVKGERGFAEVKAIIKNFHYHFNEAGIGTVSEIFDGDAPHSPRGCIAQAWSVGELLRVIREYGLQEKRKTMKKIVTNA